MSLTGFFSVSGGLLEYMNLQEKKDRLAKLFRGSKYAKNEAILNAFLKVPREEFVLEKYRDQTYDDHPLPIMASQTISAPSMAVLILTYGRFDEGDIKKVLEIGAGSGYQAALIAELMGEETQVYSVERIATVAEFAQKNLERTGYSDRVTVICSDGTEGYPEEHIPPFDRIVITAAGPKIPKPLIMQLRISGYLYMPLGQPGFVQSWIEVKKESETQISERFLDSVMFVPLIGTHGINENQI